jgi:N-formylglutamate amidohydrolase
MMPVFDFIEGSTPLLISMPHCGTAIPAEYARGMTDVAQQVADTDWHLERLFDGRLPDVNIGTAGGGSCAPEMLAAVETLLAEQKAYTYVINQRFKGGYITRAYGNPQADIHSLQLELSQRTYMEEQLPFHYLPDLAAQVQPLLRQLVQSLIAWAQREAR